MKSINLSIADSVAIGNAIQFIMRMKVLFDKSLDHFINRLGNFFQSRQPQHTLRKREKKSYKLTFLANFRSFLNNFFIRILYANKLFLGWNRKVVNFVMSNVYNDVKDKNTYS